MANETIPNTDIQPALSHAQIPKRRDVWLPNTVTLTVTQPEACEAAPISTITDAFGVALPSVEQPLAASMPPASAQPLDTDNFDEIMTGDQFAAAWSMYTPFPSTTSTPTPELTPESTLEPTNESHVIRPTITRFSSRYPGSISASQKIFHYNTASNPSATGTVSNQSPKISSGPPFVASGASGIGSSGIAFLGNGGIESRAAMVLIVACMTMVFVLY